MSFPGGEEEKAVEGLIQCPYNTLRSLDKSTTEGKKIAGGIFSLYKIYGAFLAFF